MRILAIDPGYERVGIAVLEKNPREKETLIYSDCYKTSAKIPFYNRIAEIAREITIIIEKFNPQAIAIETLFFSSNKKTAMQVSEARGVIIHSACVKNLQIYEYSPLQIKMAITGNGKSDKKSIINMVPKLIKVTKEIKHDDEYDAIAVGLTCFAIDSKQH